MPARLVTIPISHFCEKARWALDRAGVEYAEQPHLQFIHIVAARLAGGGRTVPVFVTGEGQVLADSSAILRWADTQVGPDRRLYPEGELGTQADALESWLDEGFGPDGRLWMYDQTLPVVYELRQWALAGLPAWERRAFVIGKPAAMPEPAAREVRRLRSHPAGVFAARLYDEQRIRPVRMPT